MNKIIAAILVTAAVTAAAACTNTAPHAAAPVPASHAPQVEEFYGQAAGMQAAAEISGAVPVSFPSMHWVGPVVATVQNVTLGSGKDGTVRVFRSSAGDIAVRYGQARPVRGAPVVTGQAHGDCFISQTPATGNYTIDGAASTGRFKGASGHGSWSLIFLTETKLPAGRKQCSTTDPGAVVPSGAQVTFTASGPLTAG